MSAPLEAVCVVRVPHFAADREDKPRCLVYCEYSSRVAVPGLGFFWPKHKEPLVLVMLGIEALHSVAGLRGLLLGRNHMFGVWLTASDDKICYKQFVEAC